MEIPLQINSSQEVEKIIDFIKPTFTKADKSQAVIALSGGIDSATTLFLTVQALGAEHVQAFHFPAKTSHPQNLEDAKQTALAAGLPKGHFHVVPIGAIIQKTWRIIHHYSHQFEQNSHNSKINQLRLANLTARVRMMLIYDQAKKYDALVVGTENLSEHLLGYYTRFGDEASDIEPIRHLYKTQVIQLAKHLGIPQNIIDKPPSADLWRGQTDAGELGFTYQDADPILHHLVTTHPEADLCTCPEFNQEIVKKIQDQITRTDFKHEVPYTLNRESRFMNLDQYAN